MKNKKHENIYLTDDVKKFAKRRKIKRIIIASVIFLIIAFVFVKKLKKPKPRVENEAIPVQVMKIVKTDVERIIRINGEIKAQFGASIFSDVTGRVRAIFKREGEFVAAGTPLVSVDRRSLGVDYLDFIVRSPISGVVGSVDVEAGYTISANTQLMKVVNPRLMECYVDLVEKDIGSVKIGMIANVLVDAYNVIFKGRITKISTIVHPQTRTFQVTIILDNANYPNTPLKDGMYANATIVTGIGRNATVVPYSAILDNEGEKYLFVASKEMKNGKEIWISHRRTIKIGSIKRVKQSDGEFIDFIEIESGVQADEYVVFMGHRFLQDKTQVELRTEIGSKMRIQDLPSVNISETERNSAGQNINPSVTSPVNTRRPAAAERRNTTVPARVNNRQNTSAVQPAAPVRAEQRNTPAQRNGDRQRDNTSGQPNAAVQGTAVRGSTIRGSIPVESVENRQNNRPAGSN